MLEKQMKKVIAVEARPKYFTIMQVKFIKIVNSIWNMFEIKFEADLRFCYNFFFNKIWVNFQHLRFPFSESFCFLSHLDAAQIFLNGF